MFSQKIMSFINAEEKNGLEANLKIRGNMLATKHLFKQEDIDAINAAIACRRPLLLTGDPGTGKSQLARAAASRLGAAFVSFTVDSRTESRDLLWNFDAIARLADAQLGQALHEDRKKLRQALALRHYIHPGPLWWGFNWLSAKEQAECAAKRLLENESDKLPDDLSPEQWDGGDYTKGCVVLIDEIDKAELSVPNGLLEALGDGCFLPEGHKRRVTVEDEGIPPLVIITSNQERILPDAFLRRCLVHDLSLPKERDKLIKMLMERGKAHFNDLSDKLLSNAADRVANDRQFALDNHIHPLPGQAEYLDLLRGVYMQASSEENRNKLLDKVEPYAVSKGFSPNR